MSLHHRASHRVTERLPSRRAGAPSTEKSKEMLRHGEVRGHPLTKKQRGLFGAIAGRGQR